MPSQVLGYQSLDHPTTISYRNLDVVSRTSRTTLDAQHEWHRSPAQRLPAELITEIFMLFYWDMMEGDDSWDEDFEPADALVITESEVTAPTLVLAQICSSWRAVALATSILWTHISVDLASYLPGIQHLALLYLRNSAPKKLTIALNCSNFDEFGNRVDTIDKESWIIVKEVFAVCERWEHIRFNLNHAIYDQLTPRLQACALSAKPLSLPSNCLTSLELGWDTYFGPLGRTTAEIFSALFITSPALRTLTLDLFSKMFIGFPLHQLTDLRIKEDSTTDILLLLPECPNLRNLSIPCQSLQIMSERDQNYYYLPGQSGFLTLTFLEALTIKPLVCYSKASRILSCLLLPNLHLLDLQVDDTLHEDHLLSNGMVPNNFWVQTVKALLWRSSICRRGQGLCRLNLKGLHFKDSHLLQVLSLTPNLQELEIDAMGRYEDVFSPLFFAGLTVPWPCPLPLPLHYPSGIFLPRLSTLSLKFSERNFLRDDFDLLLDRFHKRREELECIRRLPYPKTILSMVASRCPTLEDGSVGLGGWKRLERFEFQFEIPEHEMRVFRAGRLFKDEFRDESRETWLRMKELRDRGLDLRVTIVE